ncbi:unnamed protein product, partial [marine sediment metagenome]
FSSEIAESLMENETSGKGTDIFALLGTPGISRTSTKFQYVFLNGRFIRDKFVSHAIKEAYRGSLEPDRFPVVFVFIQMPYEDYDVNVHPTKIEVRFFNANLVHSEILAALREKLLATNLETQVKLPSEAHATAEAKLSAQGYKSQKIADAMADFFKKHRPIQTQQQLDFRKAAGPKTSVRTTGRKTHGPQYHIKPHWQREFIQIHDSFIVAEADDGFIIIDQHALHERILYEELQKRIKVSKLESQK